MNTTKHTTWAADIGGTQIKLALLDEHKTILERRQIDVNDRTRLEPQLAQMVSHWQSMTTAHPACATHKPLIALAFAGIVETTNNRILSTNGKYLDAPDLDLAAWAQSTCHAKLVIENDARAACVGEWKAGAGRGCNNLAIMTLGTGIGTSTIIEGKLLRGIHGQAGVLGGHLPVMLNGPDCTCGSQGCAEAIASTAHLPELIQRILKQNPTYLDSPIAKLKSPSYLDIHTWANQNDVLAQTIERDSIQTWGAAAVGLVHAYDPERLILAGGVGRSWPAVRTGIQKYLDDHAWTPWGRVDVLISELGDDAALIGAAWLPELSASSQEKS
ncbi:ROK family protein [Poriferisphaera sp. WC338]|uniref:ROK family protein n=1 Tax=Poriferisphaera sp. WC338 TaxID=3425129 RepID=UPI003D817A4C